LDLTPPSDDDKPSLSQEDQEESEADSPDKQRMELTLPGEDEQGEGSSSTLVDESASSGEVSAVQNNSEQMHMYHTRSLRSKK